MVKLTEKLVLARSRASDLENVRKLNCWGSDLTDMTILRRMPNVQIASLSVNHISTLADFAFCENLEELYIRKNDISNLAEICYLRQLPKLRILWLSDNPCAVGDRYRMTVLKALPNLQKLDNIAVQQDEVNEAIEQGMDLSTPGSGDSKEASSPTEKEAVDQNEAEAKKETSRQESSPIKSNTDINCNACASSRVDEIHVSKSLKEKSSTENTKENPATLSLEETNRIRAEIGLKPLPISKVNQVKPRTYHGAKARNANVLQAVLHLLKELDSESLEIVSDAVRNRLESL